MSAKDLPDLVIQTSKTIGEALEDREKEMNIWRPLLFHLFASIEIER
jgi:hypothetical protein